MNNRYNSKNMPDFDDLSNSNGQNNSNLESRDYRKYKEAEKDVLKSKYEDWARKLGSIKKIDLKKIPLAEDGIKEMEKDIDVARLKVTQEDIGSLLFLPLLVVLPIFSLLAVFLPTPLTIILWTVPLLWAYWVTSYPNFKATVTKIKSSDEALKIILYMAMQIKINPNLERGLKSAAEHTEGPLSRDLSKILWDLDTNKYTTAKEGLAENMKFWRDWSPDFVKSLKFLVDSIGRIGESQQRMIRDTQREYDLLATEIENICGSSVGNRRNTEITLNMVRGLFVSDTRGEPDPEIPERIADQDTAEGNYVCLTFIDQQHEGCVEIGCDVNMTYMGIPQPGSDMYIAGGEDEIYSYDVTIEKTDVNEVKVNAEHIIP